MKTVCSQQQSTTQDKALVVLCAFLVNTFFFKFSRDVTADGTQVFIKKFALAVLALFTLTGIPLLSNAATLHHDPTTGYVTSITGLNINGTLYNATFYPTGTTFWEIWGGGGGDGKPPGVVGRTPAFWRDPEQAEAAGDAIMAALGSSERTEEAGDSFFIPIDAVETGDPRPEDLFGVQDDNNELDVDIIGFESWEHCKCNGEWESRKPFVSFTGVPILVNSIADTVDISPGDGVCADGSGNCTLRAAVMEANALPSPDIVDVPAGTYTLTMAGQDEDASFTGDLDITDDLTINGAGEANTIIDASGIDRVLHIINGQGLHIISGFSKISNVTVTGGNNLSGPGGGGILISEGGLRLDNCSVSHNEAINGGGIYNAFPSRLYVANSVVSKNSSIGAGETFGGGIFNNHDAFLNNCIISDNLSGNSRGHGGGVYNAGGLTVSDCRFSGNQAIGSAGGGGMENIGYANIENSTFSGNYATDDGGGITVSDGGVNIESSTVSSNIADSEGGGIFSFAELVITNSTLSFNEAGETGGFIDLEGGSLTITNSTISNNSVVSDSGGGIFNENTLVMLANTIVADNKNGNCGGESIISLGHNLEDTDSCGFTESSDIINTDPRLGSFIDNGIPGEGYFPLLSDSPVIDKGDNDACPPYDQIGSPRFDGDGDGSVVCDIGAIERHGLALLNDNVTFEPDPSTYTFTQDASGCPSGFVGKFGFEAQLINVSQSTLFGLNIEVEELSNANLLLTADGTIGVGGIFPVPREQGYSDRLLTSREYVDVPFAVCLNSTKPFRFFVDVRGFAAEEPLGEQIRDQGRIFGTSGFLLLGTDEWSQSITTGITGRLAKIQIQFGEGIPTPTPTLNLSIFDGGNPLSGSALFSEQLNLTSADLDGDGVFTWDLSSANLFFAVGDVFSLILQADEVGYRIEGNNGGYDGGDLFRNRIAYPELSDIAFITFVEPIPIRPIRQY